MKFQFDDGGRKGADFTSTSTDCVARAIAIATQIPYSQVFNDLNTLALKERRGKRKKHISNANKGVHRTTYQRYLESVGWKWMPLMTIGTGCKVHMKEDELPSGRLILRVSKHLCAVIDRVIHDTHNPSRNGTRCVYGYFYKP